MINYLANPVRFLKFARIAAPIFAGLAVISALPGLYFGLFASPADEQQGEAVRMMYVHVPAAWCALFSYTALAIASLVSFIWRHPLADSGAKAFALPGMAFTFLALTTGSLWGRPTWGTWWQWDGRMTSVLILFFIYAAYLGIYKLIPDPKRANRMASIFAMVGFINIPIIKFSVEWWNTLHQPATLSNIDGPGLPGEMFLPLALMTLSYTALLGWLVIRDMRADIYRLKAARRSQTGGAAITVEAV